MSTVGFEPIFSAGKLPKAHALNRTANVTGTDSLEKIYFIFTICYR
jgi:hypothetical protein